MIYILAESNLTIHTFVDEGKITLDLFTCDLSVIFEKLKVSTTTQNLQAAYKILEAGLTNFQLNEINDKLIIKIFSRNKINWDAIQFLAFIAL